MMERQSLTVVVPVFNEEQTLDALHQGIVAAAESLGVEFEVIFVDDGSHDGSPQTIRRLCNRHPRTRAILLAANQGKAAALDAGFRRASGDIIVTMDADLQDDPEEIPRFVRRIEEGFDLVVGWKAVRRDPWNKRLASRIFNAIVRLVCGIRIHDMNCGFKAFSRQTVERLSIYGELHRFVPVFVANIGGKMTEIEVRHHPRRHGRSKYGISRLPKALFDLLTVLLTTRFLKRPMHFFGWIGVFSSGVGSLMLGYLAVLWLVGFRPIGNRPLLFYGLLLVIVGVQLLSLGLLGELINKVGYPSETAVLSELVGFGERGTDRITFE